MVERGKAKYHSQSHTSIVLASSLCPLLVLDRYYSTRKYLFGFTVLSATAAAIQNIAVWLRIKSRSGQNNENVYAYLMNLEHKI